MTTRVPTFPRGKSELLRKAVETAHSEDVPDTAPETDDYDTDLEDVDDLSGETVVQQRRSSHGRTEYKATCARLGQKPVRAVLHGLCTGSGLTVRHRCMTSPEVLAVCNALAVNRHIDTLVLDSNKIGDEGARHVANLLAEPNSRITHLSLAENSICAAGIEAIFDTLKHNKTLEHLNLSGNSVHPTNAQIICEVLEKPTSLTHLDLSHNILDGASCKPLSVMLGANESLRYLDISWNNIHAEGAARLFYGLKENVHLKTFRVAMNGLALPGAEALARCLRCNASLAELDVSFNRINDEGAVFIARALQVNETLHTLKIDNNPVTSNGIVSLLKGIQKNTCSSLRKLDLSSMLQSFPVHNKADVIIKELQNSHPNLEICHGVQIGTKVIIKLGDFQVQHRNPLAILIEYMTSKGYRLIDFFKQFDKDGSGAIDRNEFVTGLNNVNVPLTTSQLDSLIQTLDSDGDGEIDFKELADGEKEYRLQQRAKKARELKQQLSLTKQIKAKKNDRLT